MFRRHRGLPWSILLTFQLCSSPTKPSSNLITFITDHSSFLAQTIPTECMVMSLIFVFKMVNEILRQYSFHTKTNLPNAITTFESTMRDGWLVANDRFAAGICWVPSSISAFHRLRSNQMISLKTCKLDLWGFSIPVIYPMIDAFWLRAWWHRIILIYKDLKCQFDVCLFNDWIK